MFFIYFILISFAIQAESKSELIEKYFNHKEVQRLNQLVNDFDQHIISTYPGDLVTAWHSFFATLASLQTSSEIKEKINLSKEEQDKMLNKVETKTLEKIWNISLSSSRKGKKHIKLESLKYKSNYTRFLEDLSEENELIKNYIKNIEVAGDISPVSVSNLIQHQTELNIGDTNIRFFLAVHYLSLNKDALKRL